MLARARVSVQRVRGSLVVQLPKEVIELEDINVGDNVAIEVRKTRASVFGIFPGIGPMTREDELDTRAKAEV